MGTKKQCKECGGHIAANIEVDSSRAGKKKTKFCSTMCRKKYNNRRANRGAILYDLALTMRKGRAPGAFGDLCHQITLFLQADKEDGRITHNNYKGEPIPYITPKSDPKGK